MKKFLVFLAVAGVMAFSANVASAQDEAPAATETTAAAPAASEPTSLADLTAAAPEVPLHHAIALNHCGTARTDHLFIQSLLCTELVFPYNTTVAEQFHRVINRRTADVIGIFFHFRKNGFHSKMVIMREHDIKYRKTLRRLTKLFAVQILRQFCPSHQYRFVLSCDH